MSKPASIYDIIPAGAPGGIIPANSPHHDEREVLDLWIDTLRAKRTRTEYRKLVTEALDYLGGLPRVSQATLARYHGMLMRAMDEGALSSSSVAVRLSALRGFLRYAGVPRDVLEMNLQRPSVGVERPYNVVSDDEIKRMQAACTCPRDRAIILLLRETGARCDELCTIKVSDITTSDTGLLVLNVRKGKGNKTRQVPLSQRAAAQISELLTETGRTLGPDGSFLLQSRKGGGRLATSRIRQVLIDARERAGIAKRVSAHAFRHTAATRWLRKGGKINEVGALLGHESAATTGRYLKHVELDDLAKIVDA